MAIWNEWRITRAGVVFVVGIIVLAALVFGGIWLVRERGEQARREEAVKIAEQNLEKQSEVATGSTPAQESSSEEQSTAVIPTTATGELPATGPELSHIVILTIIALAISYYVSSRRALSRL